MANPDWSSLVGPTQLSLRHGWPVVCNSHAVCKSHGSFWVERTNLTHSSAQWVEPNRSGWYTVPRCRRPQSGCRAAVCGHHAPPVYRSQRSLRLMALDQALETCQVCDSSTLTPRRVSVSRHDIWPPPRDKLVSRQYYSWMANRGPAVFGNLASCVWLLTVGSGSPSDKVMCLPYETAFGQWQRFSCFSRQKTLASIVQKAVTLVNLWEKTFIQLIPLTHNLKR